MHRNRWVSRHCYSRVCRQSGLPEHYWQLHLLLQTSICWWWSWKLRESWRVPRRCLPDFWRIRYVESNILKLVNNIHLGCVDEICAPDDTDCDGYVCQCPEGYETSVVREEVALDTVDGETVTAITTTYICSDINECAASPLRNSCPANSGMIFYKYVNLCRHLVCTDLPGSPFTCSCVAGYEDSTGGLDPAVPACVNRNECIGFVCNSLASCEDTEGSFVCNCPVGFSGDGITGCSNVDECTQDPSPCSAPAVCIGQLITIQHRRRNHTFKIRWVHSRVFVQLVLLLPMMAPVWMSTSAHLVGTTVKRVKRVWIYLEVSLVSVSSTLKILVILFWV